MHHSRWHNNTKHHDRQDKHSSNCCFHLLHHPYNILSYNYRWSIYRYRWHRYTDCLSCLLHNNNCCLHLSGLNRYNTVLKYLQNMLSRHHRHNKPKQRYCYLSYPYLDCRNNCDATKHPVYCLQDSYHKHL